MGEFIHELLSKTLNFVRIFEETGNSFNETAMKIIPSDRKFNSASNTTKFIINGNSSADF